MYTYYMFKAIAAGWRVVVFFCCYDIDYGRASIQRISLSNFTVPSHFQKGNGRSIESPLARVSSCKVYYFHIIASFPKKRSTHFCCMCILCLVTWETIADLEIRRFYLELRRKTLKLLSIIRLLIWMRKRLLICCGMYAGKPSFRILPQSFVWVWRKVA